MKAIFNFVDKTSMELLDLDKGAIERIKEANSSSMIVGNGCIINLRNVTCIRVVEEE